MKGTMLVLAAATMALAGASALAEQGGDREAVQALTDVAKAWETAYNAKDPGKIAAMFAPGAVYITPAGTVLTDQKEMEKALAARIEAGWTQEWLKVMDGHASGADVWGTGEYGFTGTGPSQGKTISGYYAMVLDGSGPARKIRLAIANLKPSQDVTGMARATAK